MKIINTAIRANQIQFRNYNIIGENFQINPEYYKKITKLDENNYSLLLFVYIKNTKKNPFPIQVEIEFEATYQLDEIESDDALNKFLNVTAIQALFPFIRTAINSVVTAALLPPLILPIIDVREFKNKD